MTIWTPSGEHAPDPDPRQPQGAAPGSPTPPGGYEDFDGPAPTEAELAEMREMLAQVVATPVAAFVAQHAAQLHELALVHLSTAQERGHEALAQAEVAIDAMAGIVEGTGARLGNAAQPLADALAQARLAFVQIAGELAGDVTAAASGAGGESVDDSQA